MRQRLFSFCRAGALILAGQGIVFAAADAAESGAAGTVTVSPSCPGPERPGRVCVAPLAGAEVRLLGSSGKVAGSATATNEGRFTIKAPAGNYEIKVEVDGVYPRCPTLPVAIRKGRMAHIDIGCDSGMR